MRVLRIATPFLLVAAISSISSAQPSSVSSQRKQEIEREAIVMVQGNALTLPDGAKVVGPNGLRSVSPGLGKVIAESRVEQIGRSFPEAHEPEVKRNKDGIEFRDIDLTRIFTLRVPSPDILPQLIDRLKSLPEVIFAEANGLAEPRSTPNDPSFGLQWGMQNGGRYSGKPGSDIHAGSAWDLHQGSAAEIMGIVDAGNPDPSHTDFGGRVFGALGSVADHATHVAGIAGAVGNNLVGVAGVNWRAGIRADIIGDENTTAGAIRGSVDAGAKVLNNSWGQGGTKLSCEFKANVEAAIAYAYKNNALFIIAMPETGSPCDYPNVYLTGKGILNVGASAMCHRTHLLSHTLM